MATFLFQSLSPFRLEKLCVRECGLTNAVRGAVRRFLERKTKSDDEWKLRELDLSGNRLESGEFERLLAERRRREEEIQPDTIPDASLPEAMCSEEVEEAPAPFGSQRPSIEEEFDVDVESGDYPGKDPVSSPSPSPQDKELGTRSGRKVTAEGDPILSPRQREPAEDGLVRSTFPMGFGDHDSIA
jgi:hypothetical protein